MMAKGNAGISQKTVALICPKCGRRHEELLVKVLHHREVSCPYCGFCFEVEI